MHQAEERHGQPPALPATAAEVEDLMYEHL